MTAFRPDRPRALTQMPLALAGAGLAVALVVPVLVLADPGRPPRQNGVSPPAPRPESTPRTGPVRVVGRALTDDGGAWNTFQASLFWALWGERHDPDKLDRNLTTLADANVDAVRILAMVGAQPDWEDRVVDPADPTYWSTVEALFLRLGRHGLRAQVTLFADAQVMMPSGRARERFADQWREFAETHAGQITFLEVANEYWQNGFDDESAVRDLGTRLARGTVPVALSAPAGVDRACALYAGSAADLATVHYDRDRSLAEGGWRPQQLPWNYPARYDEDCRGQLPAAVANNEPIGPESSVASDADPLRLATGMAASFVSGNAVYTFHAGPGIQGGNAAAMAEGRSADYTDLDPGILGALSATHRRLPPGLAAWTRHHALDPDLPWAGFETAVGAGGLTDAVAATDGTDVVLVLLGLVRPVTVTARRAMTLTVFDPRDGARRDAVALRTGDTWTIGAALSGLLVIGTLGTLGTP